ncbi:MAG: alpha/beta hydrolase [Clostridia bacterium]|nr:alpha/beta hydrolase [Clostridia bacterium]
MLTALIVILIALAVLLIAALLCFFRVFYSPPRRPLGEGEYDKIPGRAYDPYREQIRKWQETARAMDYTEHSVRSFDGLRLTAKLYDFDGEGPIELMAHGYRGTAERDMCGGIFRARELGHSAFLINHRAAADSDGHVITFGAKERYDILTWINYINSLFDGKRKIILTGISMGAATVMLASAMELPPNVVGVLADCGYTSAEAIIKKVIRDMHLPPALCYPLVRLGALIYGGFDPNDASPVEALRNTHLPIIFVHGDADGFVPAYMSEENYNACASENKRLLLIEGADHGLAYPKGQDDYVKEVREFFAYIKE